MVFLFDRSTTIEMPLSFRYGRSGYSTEIIKAEVPRLQIKEKKKKEEVKPLYANIDELLTAARLQKEAEKLKEANVTIESLLRIEDDKLSDFLKNLGLKTGHAAKLKRFVLSAKKHAEDSSST
uniref:SAM domain-containing protein n=3 Tax=Lotharella globosa TaxID=91324 RepID=A0A7S3Y9Z2_9EUKA|mmetsp:Transcript_38286/g.73642  ORF Transcript_38286/g.73642 Transcript_38286/m.73642 type:complete len:123 (+) Transcript_38286:208-576(+)